MACCACAAARRLQPRARRACRAATLHLPYRRVKSGSGTGTIGKLTGGLLTRQLYYEQAALCALVPLLNPSLYPGWGGAGAGAAARPGGA